MMSDGSITRRIVLLKERRLHSIRRLWSEEVRP
jgi:hypothetical protein